LTKTKNDLENEVELKSNAIRKRDEDIIEKEREVSDAIDESDRLRLEIDTLQQQHNEAMVEDKEMSDKIKKLEVDLAEQENTIMNLRKKQTMTGEEIDEKLGKITKGQEKKIDDLSAKFEFLADTLMKVLKSQEKK